MYGTGEACVLCLDDGANGVALFAEDTPALTQLSRSPTPLAPLGLVRARLADRRKVGGVYGWLALRGDMRAQY